MVNNSSSPTSSADATPFNLQGPVSESPTTQIVGGSSNQSITEEERAKQLAAAEARDTARQLETIDPHLGLAYESKARVIENRTTPNNASLFGSSESAQGQSFIEPRFKPVGGGQGYEVPSFKQTIQKRDRPRYEQALNISEASTRLVYTEQPSPAQTETATTQKSGYERRIEGVMEREQNLETFKTNIYDKLRIAPSEEQPSIFERGFIKESIKYTARLPLEVASIPVVIGGRVALAAEAALSKEGRAELYDAASETPKEMGAMFDPRKPGGLTNVALIFTPLALKGPKVYRTAKFNEFVGKTKAEATSNAIWTKDYVIPKTATKLETNILANPKASPQLKAIIQETSGAIRQDGIPTLKGTQTQLTPKAYKAPALDTQVPLQISKVKSTGKPLPKTIKGYKADYIEVPRDVVVYPEGINQYLGIYMELPKQVPSIEVGKIKAGGEQTRLVSEVTGTSYFKTRGGTYSSFLETSMPKPKPIQRPIILRSRMMSSKRASTGQDLYKPMSGTLDVWDGPRTQLGIGTPEVLRAPTPPKPFKVVEPKPILYVGTKTNQKIGSLTTTKAMSNLRKVLVTRTDIKLGQAPKTNIDFMSRTSVRTRQNTRTGLRLIQKQDTKQDLKYVTIQKPFPDIPKIDTKANTPSPTTPPRPPKKPRPLLGFNLKIKQPKTKKGANTDILGNKLKYQSSLVARAENIKAPRIPKRLTGLGIRPIIQ